MGLVASERRVNAGIEGAGGVRCLVDLDAPCNLRCTRCTRTSRGAAPDRRLASNVAERVIEQVEAVRAAHLTVAFYGGEPLLNLDLLLEHSTALQDYCAWRGLEYRAGVVTNGTLLDGHAARLLCAAGVSRALVTLEGPPALHDRRRPLADGRPSFDQILANVALARHWLSIMIRYDASDPSRIGPLSPLLRLLDREGLLDGAKPLQLLVHRASGYAAQARLLLDGADGVPPLDPGSVA
jgi:uncharacterized protein